MRVDVVRWAMISLFKGRMMFWAAAMAGFLLSSAAFPAENVNFEPQALAKLRSEICLKATHAQVADLENDINHLALLSETCRAEYGTKVCGLPDKVLESDKLEERYAYYVRRPLESRAGGSNVKVDKHKWETQNDATSR